MLLDNSKGENVNEPNATSACRERVEHVLVVPAPTVRDYNELSPFKDFIDDKLDHRHLDDIIDGPSTAKNLARFLYDFARGMWPEVVAMRVSETPKTWAEYRPGP